MYDSTDVKYIEQANPSTESRIEATRGWGKGNGKVLLNEYTVSRQSDEKVFGNRYGNNLQHCVL